MASPLNWFRRNEREGEYVRLVQPVSPIRDGAREYIDEQIISRHLMAEKGKEEGLLVSNAMIDDYLAMSAGGAEVSPQLMKEINREVNGGRVPMAGSGTTKPENDGPLDVRPTARAEPNRVS